MLQVHYIEREQKLKMSSISKIKRVRISTTTKKISTRSRKFFFLLFFILLKDHKKSRKNSNIDTPCPLLRQEMNERFDGQFSILKSSIVAFFDPSRPSRCKHYYLFYNLYKKCNYMINFQGFFAVLFIRNAQLVYKKESL